MSRDGFEVRGWRSSGNLTLNAFHDPDCDTSYLVLFMDAFLFYSFQTLLLGLDLSIVTQGM